MTLAIIQLITFQLVLPAIFIFMLWKGNYSSRLIGFIEILFSVMYFTWIFFSGRWDWLGYYIRYVWIIILIAAIYQSWKKIRKLTSNTPLNSKQKLTMGFEVVILLVFTLYNIFIASSYITSDNAIELSFPLNEGTYYVGQGGNHVQMNYHNAYEPQQYALDITKLNRIGMRAKGLYPSDLDNYAIYGDPLYSPCSGKVLEVRDDLPDLTPPKSNPDQPEGNYVALTCSGGDAMIYIAHMQEGSVDVDKGDIIQEGQPIGSVGNSGNSTEPHLHIHAEKNGVGVPIRFDGKFLTRNSIVR